MKFKFNPKTMLAKLKLAGNAVGHNSTVPIYENLLINIEDGVCYITGFNGDISISTMIDVEVETEGTVTIPSKKLAGVCSSLTKHDSVSLELKDNAVTMRAGRGRFKIATLPALDFPRPVDIEGDLLPMGTSEFLEAVSHVSHAMAKSDVRYYLNGMLFDLEGNKLKCVATDGHRLAMYGVDVSHDKPIKVILPNNSVNLLAKVFAGSDSVSIRMNSQRIQFDSGDVRFTSNLIDGRFPDYNRVIPEKAGLLVADRRNLMELLSRISVLTGGKYRGVQLSLSKNMLVAEGRDGNEKSRDEMEVEFLGSIEIGVNVDYLLDAMSVIDSQMVNLYFPAPDRACIVESSDDDSELTCVVMPMRL